MGITVLVVNDAQNFDKVYESIEMIGKATGESENAAAVVADMQAKLKDVQEKAKAVTADERKNVFIESVLHFQRFIHQVKIRLWMKCCKLSMLIMLQVN